MKIDNEDIKIPDPISDHNDFMDNLEYLMLKDGIRMENEQRAEVEAAIQKEVAEAEERIRAKYRGQGYSSEIVGDTPKEALAKSILQRLSNRDI